MIRANSPRLVSPDPGERRHALAEAPLDDRLREIHRLLVRAGASEDLARVDRLPPLDRADAEALAALDGFAWELLASNPTSPAFQLEKIARLASGTTEPYGSALLGLIAKNPSANLPSLLCAAAVAPAEVQLNTTFALELLARGLGDLSLDKRCFKGMLFLAGEPSTPTGLLGALVQAERQRNRAFTSPPRCPLALIVANRADAAELCETLASLDDEHVTGALLRNPAMPPSLDERLATSGSKQQVAMAAAQGQLARETFFRLLTHDDRDLREAAFGNPSLPPDLRSLFARTGAFGSPPEPLSLDEQELLLASGKIARDLLVENTQLAASTLETLARGSRWKSRALELLASCPEVALRRLVELLCNSEHSVRQAALNNPARPQRIVDLLIRAGATDDLEHPPHGTPPTPPLSARDTARLLRLGPFALLLLARHPCASPRALAEIHRRASDNAAINRALAQHPSTPASVVEGLASHPSSRVRAMAARSRKNTSS